MKPSQTALMQTELDLPLLHRGKVRDTYELDGERLLMVASDRISAFDHVLPVGVPDKGRVLTQLSIWWFMQTHGIVDNHLISGMVPDLPERAQTAAEELAGRFMIVRRAKRIDIECVVRGYLAGSAWGEYKKSGTLAGEKLPAGLGESAKLPEPIFSPATKEETGHDQNITFKEMQKLVGKKLSERLREVSVALYGFAAEQAANRGLILADTKFEFGTLGRNTVILIDELLTPDSSRFWDQSQYRLGTSPVSFDKQYVRDWLDRSGWDRESPPPALPREVVSATREKYLSAYEQLTGKPLFEKVRV